MFWSGGRTSHVNYGDIIGPALVTLLSSRPVEYAGVHDCDLIAAGSILERYARHKWRRAAALNFRLVKVWGSGTIREDGACRLGRANIASVRGSKTLAKLGLPPATPVGDPGILAHMFLQDRKVAKTARWGIIPHLNDLHDPQLAELHNRTARSRIIDLSNPDVSIVTSEIAACDFIASSSLHGLIAANSLGIPNFRMVGRGGVVGGDWKFEDYASSLGPRTLETRSLDASLDLAAMEGRLEFGYAAKVDGLKACVLQAFRSLAL